MAQIEDLAELTALDDADHMVVVDDDDVTDDAGGTTKRIVMPTLRRYLTPGYISRCKWTWVSTTSVQLEAGSAIVNGTLLSWGAALAWSGTAGVAPLDAEQAVYTYLYDSGSGTAAIEVSATAPEWDSTNECYRKTGDSTRRFVGYALVVDDSGAYKISNFACVVEATGRSVRVALRNTLGIYPRAVSGGTATSWTSFSVAQYVPAVVASEVLVSIRMYVGSSGDDAAGAVEPTDIGATPDAVHSPYAVRFSGVKTGAVLFPGSQWIPLETSQILFYKVKNMIGTNGAAYIDVFGARIYR